MSTVGALSVNILGDIDNLNRGFDKAERKIDRFAQKFDRVGKKMASVGRDLSLKVTLPILAIGGAALKTVANAIESENLFEVSMGGMADAARKWSEELSDSLGLNRYEVRETVSVFNVMLESLGLTEQGAYDMSTEMTELSYDMSSFYNMPHEQAFQKLQAGITGEIEPLKRLGILVNQTTIEHYALEQGMIEQGEEMTEQQKVMARYGEIMEQTSAAQGDLARTMDDPINKIRRLRSRMKETAVTIGMELMPMFEELLEIGEELTDSISNLTEEQLDLSIKILAVAAAIGPVTYFMGKLAGAVTTLSSVIGYIVAHPIAQLIIILATSLIAVLLQVKDTGEELGSFWAGMWYEIKHGTETAVNYMIDIINGWIDTVNTAIKWLNKLPGPNKALIDSIEDIDLTPVIEQTEELGTTIDGLSLSGENTIGTFRVLSISGRDTGAAFDGLGFSVSDTEDPMIHFIANIEKVVEGSEAAGGALYKYGGKVDSLSDTLEEAEKGTIEYYEAAQPLLDLYEKLSEQQEWLTETMGKESEEVAELMEDIEELGIIVEDTESVLDKNIDAWGEWVDGWLLRWVELRPRLLLA